MLFRSEGGEAAGGAKAGQADPGGICILVRCAKPREKAGRHPSPPLRSRWFAATAEEQRRPKTPHPSLPASEKTTHLCFAVNLQISEPLSGVFSGQPRPDRDHRREALPTLFTPSPGADPVEAFRSPEIDPRSRGRSRRGRRQCSAGYFEVFFRRTPATSGLT